MSRNRFRIARRSIWYVLRTLIIVAAIVALCFGIFVEGMHLSNLYILVTEGLEARADTIINCGDPVELTTYFTEEFIANDSALYSNAYEGFTVTSFDYRVDVKGFFVMPWSVRATFTVDDKLAAINAAADEGDAQPPVWTPGRYQVVFARVGSRWYITGLVLIEEDPETKPHATPDMSLMPTNAPSDG